ncbi:MAG: hypothetical protein ACI9UN_000924 [Granulosicoccus sp.]|jgi:hypothetical protein
MHEQQTISIGVTRCFRGVLAFLLFLALLASNVAFADSYSSLPDTDKAYIKRVCAPIQYQQDATTYRNCVEQHAGVILTSNRTPVASLDFDEQLSVQQACQKRGAVGSTNYRQCVVIEARSLEGILTADISSLSAEQIYAVRQDCAETKGGVKAYRQCVNVAVTKLKTPVIPNLELPAIPVVEQNNTEISNDPITIELTTNEPAATEFTSNEPVTTELTANEPATNELISDSDTRIAVETASVKLHHVAGKTTPTPVTPVAFRIDTPTPLVGAAESADTNSQNANPDGQEPTDANDQDPANSNKPPLEVAKDFAQKLWDQLLASLEDVTGINRIILLAALALPFFLIGFWLLMRRRSDESESYEQPQARATANQASSRVTHSMDDTGELSTQQLHFADQVDELFTTDEHDPIFADDHASGFVEESWPTRKVETAEETGNQTPSKSLSALLVNHEKGDQLGLVIEFMIYWMAFTDERYEPEFKIKIFAEKEPDDHDLIKRCVLNHDFGAFADATSWLQKNAAMEERTQVLKLLMALLVYEEAVTPVQNTMLRFLCNAFGLTHNQLDEMFQTAFGHALPPMPRPDKPTWWNKQSSDKLKRWDARSVAKQSQAIQARVKLGLPLSGELDPKQIIERHERAISRCQVENFDLLTQREQLLAESQQTKYNSATEVLMEISG